MVGRTFGPRQRVVSFTSLRSASACKVSALAGVAALALVACGGPETPPPVAKIGGGAAQDASGPKKIGMLLPLSGRLGKLGQQMANAAHIAVPEGHGVTLDIRDTDAPGQTAETAARAAIDQGDRVILGPLTAPQTSTVATLVQPAGIPEFAYTSDQVQAKPGVWVMGITVEQQVNRLVEAASAEGRKNFAAYLPDSALGHALADALGKACAARGLAQPNIAFHTGTAESITAGLKTLSDWQSRQDEASKQTAAAAPAEPDAVNPLGSEVSPAPASGGSAADPSKGAAPGATGPAPAGTPASAPAKPVLAPPPFDALLLGDTGLQLANVIDGLKQAAIDTGQTRIMGPALWNAFAAKLGALRGGWFAAPDPSFRNDFVQRYRARYGYAPSVLANVAYDTATMAAVLSQRPDGFSESSLLRPDGFAGADGTFVLRGDGTVARGLALFEILPGGGVKMASAAPRRLTR